jgi:hypothetical protein
MASTILGPSMKPRNNRTLTVCLIWLALIGGGLGVVSVIRERFRDPGYDQQLQGLKSAQLVALLGDPFESATIDIRNVDDAIARQRFMSNANRLDDHQNVMMMRWFRSDDPTATSTTVWLYRFNGEWVEFHNYRRYHWAGL